MSTVGSISHILKTAFRDVYEDAQNRVDASAARAQKIIDDALAIEQAAKDEAARLAEAQAALEAAGKSPPPAAAAAKKPAATKKGAKEPEPVVEVVPVVVVEEPEPIAPEPIVVDVKAKLLDYYAPFEKLNLDDNLLALMKEKTTKISQSLEIDQLNAGSLTSYLNSQRHVAHEEELQEEEELKKQGIMIGQHVPSLKSKLALNSKKMNEFGSFSSNLVIAKELVDQNKVNTLRRTGNLPISDLAEQRKFERTKHQPILEDDKPHYLCETHSTVTRQDVVATRFAATFKANDTRRAEQLVLSAACPRVKIPRRTDLLNAEQRIENEEILKAMNHKLNYLRNPRNNPAAANKMLNKPLSFFNTPAEEAADDSNTESTRSLANPEESSRASKVSKKSSRESGSVNSSSKKTYGKTPPLTDNPLFVADPVSLEFPGYVVGQAESRIINFRNVSAVSRTVRVIPPRNPLFTLSQLRFPANSKGGIVAPGMSVTATLQFIPNKLGDFLDALSVETESGSFKVEIKAFREAPCLSLPSMLNISGCLVGDAVRTSIACLNTGGAGSFKLIAAEDYPNIPDNMDWATMGCLRLTPFTVYPVEFALMKNESIDINIEFVPLTVDEFAREFVMLCDNNQTRTFTIRGTSRQIQVSISEINGTSFNFGDVNIKRDLFFDSACIGVQQSQHMVVVNDTGLPLEYEWVWLDVDCRDLLRHGQEKIAEREKQVIELLDEPATSNGLMLMDVESPAKHRSGGSASPAGQVFSPQSPAARVNRTDAAVLGTGFVDDTLLSLNDAPSNSAVNKEFELTPARGVLACDSQETFTVAFTTSCLHQVRSRAVMMIKGVPCAAFPDKRQPMFLQRLATVGHAKFTRFCSWVEELGEEGPVNTYKKFNGDSCSRAKLTSLKIILDVVSSHAADSVSPEVLIRLNRWVRDILRHVELWKKCELDVDEDEDGSALLANLNNLVPLSMYDWRGNDVIGPSGNNIPHAIQPINLIVNYTPPPVTADDMMTSPRDFDDAMSAASSLNRSQSQVFELDVIGPVGDSGPDTQSQATDFSGNSDFPELSAADRTMLDEIWVDSYNAIMLLGDDICQLLDEKVKHEAVEYVKEIELSNVVALSTLVSGEGKSQAFQIKPAEVFVPGEIAIGTSWQGSVTVHNNSNAMADVEFCPENAILTLVKQNFGSQCNMSSGNKLDFVFEPKRILLLPLSDAIIQVTVQPHAVGMYEATVPLRSTAAYTQLDSVHFNINVIGPRIRFDIPEIDIGLVGVSYEERKILTFTNESDVNASFMLRAILEDDNSILLMNKLKKGLNTDSRQNTHREGSRMNTHRSEDGVSVASDSSTQMTDNATASVVLDPPAGEIAAHETLSVAIICKAGRLAQRVRGTLECRLFDSLGGNELPKQFISIRGEVQTPKTILYPMIIDLGKLFVGRPVQFSVTIENICNLPTKYKLERPGGETSTFKIIFDKPKGPLGAKEKIKINCEFVALAPGITDDVVGCKIFGVTRALGFAIKAAAKGVLLEFTNLAFGEELPPSLTTAGATQLPSKEAPPEAKPTEPVELGHGVPLYERKKARLVIRNLSAIATSFVLSMKKYVVEGLTHEDAALLERSTSAQPRTDLIISAHEDGESKFQSAAGKQYIGVHVQRQEDKRFLKSGLGASYLISPSDGVLQPWGVQEVVLRTYNDMPGCFDDLLECHFSDGAARRVSAVPVHMTVEGCPLNIDKSSVGMTFCHFVRKKGAAAEWLQLLQLGTACVNSEPLVREFSVKNNGSIPGVVKWNIRNIAANSKGPLKFSLKTLTTCRLKSKILFWEDLAKDSPFKIEPEMASVPAYGQQKFKLTLFRTCNVGLERADLTGVVSFPENGMPAFATPPQSAPAGSRSTPNSNFSLSLLLEGQFMHPTLSMDKNVLVATEASTAAAEGCIISLKAQAPALFTKDARSQGNTDTCTKALSLVNPMDASLVFNISTEGPFAIKFPSDDSNLLSSSATGKPGKIMSSSQALAVNASTAVGRTYNLLPQGIATFSIAFAPRKDFRDTLGAPSQGGCSEAKNSAESGQLVISFATGQCIRVPIKATVSTPFITASSPRLQFGVCHCAQSSEGLILLSNPTGVAARWSVAHVPGGGTGRRISAIRVKGFEEKGPDEDDPSVFELSPMTGEVAGPTVSVAAATCAPPKDVNRSEETVVPQRLAESSWATSTLTMKDSLDKKHNNQHQFEADSFFPKPISILFKPKKNVKYSSRFRLSCEYGNSFDVLLQGQGTYEEHEHRPLCPMPR